MASVFKDAANMLLGAGLLGGGDGLVSPESHRNDAYRYAAQQHAMQAMDSVFSPDIESYTRHDLEVVSPKLILERGEKYAAAGADSMMLLRIATDIRKAGNERAEAIEALAKRIEKCERAYGRVKRG